MATVNSLLLLLTTLAPNVVQPPENSSVILPPEAQWNSTESLWNSPSGLQSVCHEDEYYDECGSSCSKNCENFHTDVVCPSQSCVEGCFCKDPMVRGPEGNCIYVEECPNVAQMKEHASWFPEKECPKNEAYSCSAHCQRRCEKSWFPCPGWCVPGCVCEWPLVRGPKGDCIFQSECPNALAVTDRSTDTEETCGPDEEVSCYSHCQKNCTNYDQDIECPRYCVSGCVCKEPMIRGPDGSCILPEQCGETKQIWTPKVPIPRLCSHDERFSPCQGHCQRNCGNLYQDIFCPMLCLPGCLCKEPLVRGDDGTCILPEKCYESSTDVGHTTDDYTTASPMRQNWDDFSRITVDPEDEQEWVTPDFSSRYADAREDMHQCPYDEAYSACGGTCGKTCDNFNDVMPCANCVPGCSCKPPLVRSEDGSCISKDQCPQMRSTNLGQDRFCHIKYSEWKLICKPISEIFCVSPKSVNFSLCVANCICKPPRLLHNNECILPKDCPPDARTQKAVISVEIPETGETPNFKTLPDFKKLPDLPKLKCKKENEEFSFCASVCPDNCDNYNQTDRLCKRICIPGCRCKPGYVEGDDKICIRKEDCNKPSACPESEHYDECGSDCEADCTNHNDSWRECENKDCKKGCFCNPGYVRSANGTCILISDCPAPSQPLKRWG